MTQERWIENKLKENEDESRSRNYENIIGK